MSLENITIVKRWFDEVWNQRREQAIDELVTEESVCLTDQGLLRGPREFKERQYAPFLSAFPDLRVEVEGIVGQGEQVVVRWTASGTHDGDGLGFPPTHRKATFAGMSWVHVREGKLREGWQSSNISEVVRALAAPEEGVGDVQ
jgi:steroid delta-isomerase-like uncharacterized protein